MGLQQEGGARTAGGPGLADLQVQLSGRPGLAQLTGLPSHATNLLAHPLLGAASGTVQGGGVVFLPRIP